MARPIEAISLVYNMKLRRAFSSGLGAVIHREKPIRWVVAGAPIIYKKNQHIVDERIHMDVIEKRLTSGILLDVRYIPSPEWWVEATTGIENERVISSGTSNFKASRTGFDDIVIMGGHNIFPHEDMQFIVFGLAGFPTKRDVSLFEVQDTLVGTRFFATGAGCELSYAFINKVDRNLIGIFQNRFVHFFTRKWAPILPLGSKIQPGNLIDILLSIQGRVKQNIVETGFNATFFTNRALLLKEGTIKAPNYVRNSLYGSLSHICSRFPLISPVIIGTGFVISRAHHFDTKIFSYWVSLNAFF